MPALIGEMWALGHDPSRAGSEVPRWRTARADGEGSIKQDACIARNGDLASKLVARHVAGGAITILAHAMPEREPRMIRAALRMIVQPAEQLTLRRAASA
jgi:hypothetical protein